MQLHAIAVYTVATFWRDFRLQLFGAIFACNFLARYSLIEYNLGTHSHFAGTMDSESALVLAATGIVLALAVKKGRKRRKRRIWVKTWLSRRDEKGVYNNLLQEMRLEDSESYRRYLRMNTETFETLLNMVTPVLQKQRTHTRFSFYKNIRKAMSLKMFLSF